MAQKLTAGLPENLDLTGGVTIAVVALDPTTGAPVADVVITGVQIVATNVKGTAAAALQVGPFMVVPGPGAG